MKALARAAARTEPAAAESREASKPRATPAGAPPQSAGNLTLQALLAGGLLRAKLQVGAPGDPAEQEADRMADAALAGKEGCTCAPGAPPCPRCAAGHGAEDAGASTLLRKPRSSRAYPAPAGLPPLGPARALAAHERAFFEPRYGADLSAVRIHDGPEAAAGARLLDARAFAIGSEIAFGSGEYRPETLDGRRLLGHELAHIVLGHGGLRRQEAGPMSTAQPLSTPAFTPASSPDTASSPASVLTLGGQDENMCRLDPANEDSVVFMGRTIVATNEGVRAALVEAIDLGGLALVRHMRAALENMLPHRFCNPMLGSCRDVPAQGPAVTERGRATINRLLPMIDTELTAIRADHERFKTLVRNTTRLRLQGNVRSLDLWRDFIANQIGASTLQGQVAGTVVQRYSMMAFHHPDQTLAYRALEQMLTTRSVADQRTQAAIVAGEIHGGCAHCHRLSYETNVLAGRNEPFTTPLSIMEQLQAGGEGPRPAFAEPAAAAPGTTPAPSIAPTPSMDPGVAASPTLSAAVGLAARINPYLQQLGPRGYKILPLDDVNALGLPAEALRDYVQRHIAERRAHFLAAIEAAGSSDFDYLMPLVVVQELMQLEDPTVQALVRAEIRERAEAARRRAIGLLILAGVSLLLTIFPPTAGLGIALGAVGSAIGFADSLETYQQGVLLGHMVGATDVITPEQEVAARQMRIMGQIGMVMSALDLGATGLTAAYRVLRVMRTAGAIRAVEVEAANGTRVLIEGLDSGAPVATASGAGRPPMRIELPAAPTAGANPLALGPGPRPGGLPALPGAVADTAPALVPQALVGAVGAGGARTVQRGGYLLTFAEDGAMVVTSAARPDLMIVIRGRTATFYEVLEGGAMRVVGSATVPARGAGAPAGLLPASAEAASAPPVTLGSGPIITPAPPVRPQLTSGAPTTYTWDEISRMRQPQLWQEREIYMRQVHGAAGSQYFPVPGTGGRFVDVPVAHGGRFIFAGEIKSYSRWIGVPGQRGGILNEVSLSERIQEQIGRDVWLRDNVPGYYPNWTFTDAPPSQALRQALRDAGITIVEHVR